MMTPFISTNEKPRILKVENAWATETPKSTVTKFFKSFPES